MESPPPTRRQDAVDVYHGVEVVDPYRWLEEESTERESWFVAQNDHARHVLGAIAGREALREGLHKANRDLERVQILRVTGSEPRIFMLRRGADDESHKLIVRAGWKGPERVLVDPSARNENGSRVTIETGYPSPDGRYVAYILAVGGADDGVLEIVDVDAGTILPDRIDRMPDRISWRPDGRSFFYWRRARPRPGAAAAEWYKNSAVYLHVLGGDPDAAEPLIAAGGDEPAIPPHHFPWIEAAADGRWALAMATSGTGDPAYFIAPLAAAKPGKTRWRRLTTTADKVERILVRGDRLYALTYAGAPNYRIISFDAKSGDLSRGRDFVRTSPLVLVDSAAAHDAMYVVALDRGVHRLFRIPWKAGSQEEVPLLFEGAIRKLVTDPARPGLFFSMEGWVRRPAWFRFEPGKAVRELAITGSPATAEEELTAEQVVVLGHDGVEVPLSIIRHRKTPIDGTAPALLYGYGAYGSANVPAYNPLLLLWARRGGIYATCHVRGGGERGKAWHVAGIKENKENGVSDFIRCAEYLVEKGYTSSSRLTALTASAGGILVGGAITRRPELFAAAVVRVGQLNPIRKEVTEGGGANADEYGDVRVEAEFRSLLASDPYHRVRPGVRYPAVLLTAGLRDRRVAAWVPGKFAARLQALNPGRPTLLRLDFDDGHGFGATQTQREQEYADIYSFALWQSGLAAPPSLGQNGPIPRR